jgi:amidase
MVSQFHSRISSASRSVQGHTDNVSYLMTFQGLETSMGYVSWIGKYEEEDSYLVTLLAKAGAVFYVKTSVPQSLMVCETVNNVIGRTVNPRNKNWSCGGSSGGEGAMVGFRGGIIGVGTDIGKSKLKTFNAVL